MNYPEILLTAMIDESTLILLCRAPLVKRRETPAGSRKSCRGEG